MKHLIQLLVSCSLGIGTACNTPNSAGGARTASIDIVGQTPAAIRKATIEAFEAAGYRLTRNAGREIVFERAGTSGDAIMFSGMSGGAVLMRARIKLNPLDSRTTELNCDVFAVRDAGDPFVEEENATTAFRRKEYKKILEEIQRRLTASPLAPAP
jgi:hypothetical protein